MVCAVHRKVCYTRSVTYLCGDYQIGMKILTIAPTPFFADRGTHIRILEEARAQVRRGHSVTIVTYHIGAMPTDAIAQRIVVRRIHRWLFWYKKLEAGPDWQKILLDLFLLRKVLFLVWRERPDVVHAHLHEGVLIAWIVQKLLFWRSIVVVADMHGSLVNEMASHGYLRFAFFQKIFRAVERWINNMGDVMITSSQENKEVLARSRRGPVHVVLDGVDVTYYAHALSRGERRALRRKYGVPHDACVIAYTGAMVPNKGLGYLLESMRFVHAQCPRAHFLFAGFPREHVDAFMRENNGAMYASVIVPLPYADLPDILRIADIGVDPKDSFVQQASGKILQYMGAGLPVVCFDRPNNRTYLGDAGIYAAEISARGLAQALVRAVTDADLRAACAREARRRAATFSWDRAAVLFERAVASARR